MSSLFRFLHPKATPRVETSFPLCSTRCFLSLLMVTVVLQILLYSSHLNLFSLPGTSVATSLTTSTKQNSSQAFVRFFSSINLEMSYGPFALPRHLLPKLSMEVQRALSLNLMPKPYNACVSVLSNILHPFKSRILILCYKYHVPWRVMGT